MKAKLPILAILLLLVACKSKQKSISVAASDNSAINYKAKAAIAAAGDESSLPENKPEEPTDNTFNPLVNDIVRTAIDYTGVRYKFGGTTKKGMDCSGLIYVAFTKYEIPIQRASFQMAKQGDAISLEEVRKGDLLFFTTGKKNRINHVGLVVEVSQSEIRFIHSTSSRGVLVSSLDEGYWNYAFDHARRIM
ncbi:C40 family peptidase [Robertkochia aurantiaca]|uniref:C40 family peptidase n=1 Tax=Robertkochia aurantiaca TaxID=2873700 RepID=UPI001CCBAC4C|nr:C40 family peptidase [Robertkochia sp. 3YJGBD-33]